MYVKLSVLLIYQRDDNWRNNQRKHDFNHGKSDFTSFKEPN